MNFCFANSKNLSNIKAIMGYDFTHKRLAVCLNPKRARGGIRSKEALDVLDCLGEEGRFILLEVHQQKSVLD